MQTAPTNPRLAAYNRVQWPSLQRDGRIHPQRLTRRFPSCELAAVLIAAVLLGSCGGGQPAPKPLPPAETKPAVPAIPSEIEDVGRAFLGRDTQVLAFGDLAKTGAQQVLAANVVPRTPANANLPGPIVTRAVIAENIAGKWTEVFRCDEHLKNSKGYLGGTPIAAVSGWRIQFEQDAQKGLQLYFTPLNQGANAHVLPIGVRWNPAAKRYQTLDRTFEHFLSESASLETPRSRLR